MAQAHSLTDDQVASELKKMTAFIRQEALEKAKEIHIKADEEFAIEKSKLVREETASIDAEYEKKFKQAGMSQQIARSTVANKSRLRVLAARQEVLDDMFERARKKLAGISQGKEKAKYQDICRKLVLEGMFFLNEEKMAVRAKKADTDVMKKAADAAKENYEKKMNRNVQVKVDESNPLSDESNGGVIILGSAGKIDIKNTFDERLHLLEVEALPSVRVTLFGENENRKFRD